MSDYLSRLVDRALGLAPQLEPLIAPIHAPSSTPVFEENGEISTPDMPGIAPKLPPDAGDPSPVQASARDATHPAPLRPLPASRPTGVAPVNREPSSRTATGKGATLPASAERKPATTAETITESPRSLVSPNEMAAAPHQPPRVAIQPRIVAAPVPVQPPVPASQRPPAAPAVRVTIGRVEVRAVFPPAPAPAPVRRERPEPRGKSLEEYLSGRRSGGAR